MNQKESLTDKIIIWGIAGVVLNLMVSDVKGTFVRVKHETCPLCSRWNFFLVENTLQKRMRGLEFRPLLSRANKSSA